jgi:FAD:protein FMN transferase
LDKRKLFFRIIVAIVVIGAGYRYFTSKPSENAYHITGFTMGTITYNVKYRHESELVSKSEIDSMLIAFNQSLSTYIPTSEISLLNQTGLLIEPSKLFTAVLTSSGEVFERSHYAFDPTIGPLVNIWGFGPNKQPNIPDSASVQRLLENTGFDKIRVNGDTVKMDSLMYLDFSAIAKGYAVDVLAEFLEEKGAQHYMVEIGGEVRAKGINEKSEIWSIGVEDPLVAKDESRLLAIVRLQNMSMATSGNYRNYYQIDGKTVAHTIDPRTGYNTKHNLLSASVFAKDCMTADAYATAFMVVGVDESIAIAAHQNLEIYLVYQKENGKLGSYVSPNLKQYLELNNADE